MKQGGFKALGFILCLILMAGMAGSTAFGDNNVNDFVSVILEEFGNATNHSWSVGGKNYSYDFTWKMNASKFASVIDGESYPKLTYVPSYPTALYGLNREGRDIQSLGIWGKFDRRGYNWIDLYPADVDSGEPFEIPLPGRVSYFDAWIWGSNLNFYIEIYVRDYQGVVHSLRLGDLDYQGWRNLRVAIPNSIPQSKRVLPHLANLTFVKFRIWTTPQERVDNFYVYMDHFKVLTDEFESLIDGDELNDPDLLAEFWQTGR